ncbi:NERD domain-containing protein [Streptomyces sp. NPDC006265]|uniref:NERD domain-containing protein n=1 Tax=Streptomyces sp. NPDC006265 TaxID=3156740 RepID=UPI0033ADF3AC
MTPAERPSAPKPGPPPRRTRWFQPRRSGFAWEQEGLEHVRQLMPDAEPYRAWATFQFTGPSGRVNECDLLIAVPGGLYLLELKGHPGRLVNHGDTWQFHGDRVRTIKSPLHLTDLKAKELRGQLERAARAAAGCRGSGTPCWACRPSARAGASPRRRFLSALSSTGRSAM